MNIIRRAEKADLNRIYDLQNVPFRDRVFIEPLWAKEKFIQDTAERMEKGSEYYYLQESDGFVAGFIRLLEKNNWEALTWGKWLNTLLYACGIVSFEKLQLPKVIFAVRDDNKRVLHLYKKHSFRFVGKEFVCFRSGILAPIQATNLTHYEITPEEFWQRAEEMRKNSLPLTFI